MKRKVLPVVVASALYFISHAVSAADPVIVLGEVPVKSGRGGPLLTNNVLTSVDIMGGDKVEDKNVMNSWELVGQMPGIQITPTAMGAESGKVTFRAFNGEGYINGIKVLIDGIPSNVNSGNQRFIDMIFPLEIDYIEVVRGTNDPRYGLHNIGGNINIGTRQGGNYTDSRFTYGSFNTREVQVAMGREKDGFAQNYFFAKQDSDGFRDHSKSEKYSAGAKWFITSADGQLKTGLVVRSYNHKAEAPGFLTAGELNANRRQSPSKNGNDGDDRDMKHISLHLDWQLTPDAFWSNKLYFNSYQDDRRVTFTSNAAGSGPRQRRIWDEDQLGFISTLTVHANDKVTIDGGVNLERQDNRYQRLRFTTTNSAIPTNFNSTPALIQNDDSYTLNNVGAYVQAIIKPIENLKVIPGFRADTFTGKTVINTSGATGSFFDPGWINQPKLSMVYDLNKATSIYANWGKTFQIRTGSRDPYSLSTAVNANSIPVAPSINTGKEIGFKFVPMVNFESRIAVWQQDAPNEVANMPATQTNVNLGQTRRRGIDFQLSGKATDKLDVWLSHSVQEAKVISAIVDGVSLAGKEVISTPRFISNVGAEYRASEAWRFGMQGRAQGSYFIDNANAQGKFGGFVLFDANVRYALSKTASIDFQVKNIADRKYEYVWYDNFFWPAGSHQPMFSPGAGRAAFVSLNLKM